MCSKRRKLRVVVDTNVVVSFLPRPRSVPGRAFLNVATGHTLIASAATLAEMDEVLAYRKFARYITPRTRSAFTARIRRIAAIVETTERVAICRDPRDDKFLEAAIAGDAHCIVSGDEDLLALEIFRGIPILTANAFLARGF